MSVDTFSIAGELDFGKLDFIYIYFLIISYIISGKKTRQ